MRRLLVVFVALAWVQLARADVFVGIEHAVSPVSLLSIADAISRAGARPEPQQAYALYLSIQDDVMLNCPARKPDAEGNGCSLFVTPTGVTPRGQVSMSLRKPIVKPLLIAKTNEAGERVATLDPNSTEEHLQFGNPLYVPDRGATDGTHYYCAPEGEPGKRAWRCYLSVSEMLSLRPAAK